MALPRNQFSPIRDGLLQVGFDQSRLQDDVPIPGRSDRLPLLAFSDSPFDSRTAAVAAVSSSPDRIPDLNALRPLGAPIVFVCFDEYFQLWTLGPERPQFRQRLTERELQQFFRTHRSELEPRAIYRAKVWSRLDQSFQLEFVDPSFLPIIEGDAGHKLTQLVERVVGTVKHHLGWRDVTEEDGRWLLQSVFWLLAAKILQDKGVPGFVRLSLSDIEDVYERVAKHYNSDAPRPIRVGSRQKKDALVIAAGEIQAFPHCGPVSTEALAYLYESALIDKSVRQKLGTHSTPTWLVDYIVGKLRPWVEHEIPVEERNVFEPACGHAGFLISAMRLLSELLPSDWQEPRRTYLRRKLHGVEIDPFALEIARLSLTLADVPNANGWALTDGDMFKGNLLERSVRDATIVVGNPPFENFNASNRPNGALLNKAAETFRRVVEYLPVGGVFGFVLPQTFLHAKQAADVRRILLQNYEISEIDLFADKVFRYGEPESTVLIGRRLVSQAKKPSRIYYRRVREWEVKRFSESYESATITTIDSTRFSEALENSLLLPDLSEVWDALRELPKFSEFASIGQGFSHKGDTDPTLPSGVTKVSATRRSGFVEGFAGWRTEQLTHELPEAMWLNIDPKTIQRSRWGVESGTPQVLLNYPRISREAWRLKAIQDHKGHPVLSDFLVFRPKFPKLSLSVIWGLLNSPICNAYAYCISNKRNVLTGDMRRMPVPQLSKQHLAALERAVEEYLTAAAATTNRGTRKSQSNQSYHERDQMNFRLEAPSEQGGSNDAQLRQLHWRIDAEVLRLYNLPSPLERKVLDLFNGIRRRGVPFLQTEYFSHHFTELNRLSDLLAVTADWDMTNRRRAKLIDLEEAERLTSDQRKELAELERLADARVSLLKPDGGDEIERRVAALRR